TAIQLPELSRELRKTRQLCQNFSAIVNGGRVGGRSSEKPHQMAGTKHRLVLTRETEELSNEAFEKQVVSETTRFPRRCHDRGSLQGIVEQAARCAPGKRQRHGDAR